MNLGVGRAAKAHKHQCAVQSPTDKDRQANEMGSVEPVLRGRAGWFLDDGLLAGQ